MAKNFNLLKNRNENFNDNVNEIFAQALKRLRKERSLSQHDLSTRSGISWRMISDMERGLKQPTLGTLFKLAKGLGISLRKLFREILKDVH